MHYLSCSRRIWDWNRDICNVLPQSDHENSVIWTCVHRGRRKSHLFFLSHALFSFFSLQALSSCSGFTQNFHTHLKISQKPLYNLVATWSNYSRVSTFTMKNLVTVFVLIRPKTCGFVLRELFSQLWVQWFWSQTSRETWRCKLKTCKLVQAVLCSWNTTWGVKKGGLKSSFLFLSSRERFIRSAQGLSGQQINSNILKLIVGVLKGNPVNHSTVLSRKQLYVSWDMVFEALEKPK